jgi:hypothetical protein
MTTILARDVHELLLLRTPPETRAAQGNDRVGRE